MPSGSDRGLPLTGGGVATWAEAMGIKLTVASSPGSTRPSTIRDRANVGDNFMIIILEIPIDTITDLAPKVTRVGILALS